MKNIFLSIFLILLIQISFAQNKTKPSQTKISSKKSINSPTNKQKIESEEKDSVRVQVGRVSSVSLDPKKIYNFNNSDLLVKWHELIFELIEQTQGYSPNVAARNLAYLNIAAYETILPFHDENRSLSKQLQGFERPDSLQIDTLGLSESIAVNATMFKLVDKFFISAPYIWMEKVYALNDSVNNHLKQFVTSDTYRQSKLYGSKIAYWVYEYSKHDGGHQAFMRTYNMNYKLPKCPSCFELNRVADLENMGTLHPFWGENRTFLSVNNQEIEVKPSIEFSIYQDSPFYKMANEVYTISKTVLPNSERLQIANFWDDAASFTYTAPGHSASILVQVLKQKPEKFNIATELLSNLMIAINDAMIVTWRLKFKYNLIRPITYIKRYIDTTWEPALLTPPFPEFPSGHSAQSATMATVLTEKLGENVSFLDYSKYFVGPPKFYASFWQAADECSISRVYGGIHYRDGVEQGQKLGKIIGKNALTIIYKK